MRERGGPGERGRGGGRETPFCFRKGVPFLTLSLFPPGSSEATARYISGAKIFKKAPASL